MDEAALRRLVQQKLANGGLPLKGLMHAKVGVKDNVVCDACSLVIPADQVLVEVTQGRRVVARLHGACFAVWRAEVDAAN